MPLKWLIDNKTNRPYRQGDKRRQYGVLKRCYCGAIFFVTNNHLQQNKMSCSKSCFRVYQIHGNIGRKHSTKTKNLLSKLKLTKFRNKELNYSGDKSPSWKGGRRKDTNRLKIRMLDHPYADNMGYVAEHRLVVEKALGRCLNPSEVVHHIDGDGFNNANNNLLVCHQSYHIFLHHKQGDLKRGISLVHMPR